MLNKVVVATKTPFQSTRHLLAINDEIRSVTHQLDHLESQKCFAQQATVIFPVESTQFVNVHGSFSYLQQDRPLQNT